MSKEPLNDKKSQSPFSKKELRKIAKEKILWHFGFKIHAACFVGGNIFLFALNFFVRGGLNTPWFVYPLFGWIIGIGMHGTAYLVYSRGITAPGKIGLLFHAAAFALGSIALVAFNLATNYSTFHLLWVTIPEGYWCIWPVGFWILGLISHAIAHKVFGPKTAKTGDDKSWLEKAVDKEMRKIEE